jgi:hypothetical protein
VLDRVDRYPRIAKASRDRRLESIEQGQDKALVLLDLFGLGVVAIGK